MKTVNVLSATAPWVGHCVADYDSMSTALWKLRGEKDAANVFVGALRGHRMRRRDALFDQFGALLQFPRYFGENWNAFVDCIRDLDWLRASGFVIVLLDSVEVLSEGDSDEFDVLLNVLAEAGESWSRDDEFRIAKPFHVLLHATQEESTQLHARFASLRRDVPLVELPLT